MPLQARKLEGELDVKLAAYAKLCSSFESSYRSKPDSVLGSEQVRAAERVEGAAAAVRPHAHHVCSARKCAQCNPDLPPSACSCGVEGLGTGLWQLWVHLRGAGPSACSLAVTLSRIALVPCHHSSRKTKRQRSTACCNDCLT